LLAERPPATRVDVVVDEMHGQRIEDPYRWLEDGESPETAAWTAAQNAYTRAVLDTVPGRDRLAERLHALLSIGMVSVPSVRGGQYFHARRRGDQNQPVLYVRPDADAEDRVLVDPNAANAQGTVALDWWQPSLDGSLLAYGLSENGDEWSTLYVLDVASGERLSDVIPRAKYASVAWLADNSGFYYTRFPRPGDVPPGDENYNQRIYFHPLGSDPAEDQLCLPREVGKEELTSVLGSRDGRFLVAQIAPDFYRADLYARDLHDAHGEWIVVAEGLSAEFTPIFAGDTLLVLTNLEAPNWKLMRVDLDHPQPDQWHEVIPQQPDAVLDAVVPWNGRLVAHFLKNAASEVSIHAAAGERIQDVDLPTLGSVTGISSAWDQSDAYLSFTSFAVPNTVFSVQPDGTLITWAAVDAPVDGSQYEVKQEWYTSRDGTRVSMFIVHARDLDRSRPHPTYLTGYGGFNIAMTPAFVRDAYVWLERGGIYALPNLRGGSEYGEEWHRAGMLDRKQNVFDDFITAAEYLIDQGYTDRDHLAIAGRSNGGLLVGAALTQRPDLYRAVVCGVPLLDMLRYHHFLIARWWVPEYGSGDNPEQFEFIRAYSPYHNVRADTQYPAVLFITAESDSRVDPLHARKMAARLQATSTERPILIRIEGKAGHGMGKPLTKLIEDQTDMWAFLFAQIPDIQP
jgi:prolyl oligopeptidase